MKISNLTLKIEEHIRKLTTYRAGMVQNKTYRLLKQRTTKALASMDITTAEWALLGLLNENPEGTRLARAAEEIGVEAPFVTALVRSLEKKDYLRLLPDDDDSRAKKLSLTPSGKDLVTTMEPKIRAFMRPVVQGISIKDLRAYYSVLERIAANIERLDLE